MEQAANLCSNPDVDIKNITEENKRDILLELNRLTETYNISRSRLIIESPNYKALGIFRLNNYFTSCYIDSDLTELKEDDLNAALNNINSAIETGHLDAISFYADNYEVIKENITTEINMLTWEHRKNEWKLPLFFRSRELINDERIDVILCKQKGSYHK